MKRRGLLLLAMILLPLSSARGRVVLNELLWSGTDLSTADEWVELMNTGSAMVDLSGWVLTRLADGGEEDMLILPPGSIIGSGGFFLISNFDAAHSRLALDPDLVTTDVVLSNTQLLLRLYAPEGTGRILLDAVDDGIGAPFAGSNEDPKASMERIDPEGSGQLLSNWRTATTFRNVDDGASLRGTPGAPNGSGPSEDTFPPQEATGLSAEWGIQGGSSGTSVLTVSWAPSSSLDLQIQTLLLDPPVGGLALVELPATASGLLLESPMMVPGVLVTLRSRDTRGNTSSGVTVSATLPPQVLLTEVLPNPAGADDEEWIEIANVGSESVDITGWVLDEGNSPEAYTIVPTGGSSVLLLPGEHRAFPKSLTGLPLGNQGEQLTLRGRGRLLDTWAYVEVGEEVSYGRALRSSMGAMEGGEKLYEHGVFRSFCVPTRGKPNVVVSPELSIVLQEGSSPRTLTEGEVVEGINALSLNIVAAVLTGSTAQAQCQWDFGDGAVSQSCNPPSHRYELPGVYPVRLTYTDICGEVLERSITVHIVERTAAPSGGTSGGSGGGGGRGRGSAARSARTPCTPQVFTGVRVSELLPNPEGDDTVNEWIELESMLEESTSLCGWELDDAEGGSSPFPLDAFLLPARGFLLLPRTQTRIALNNEEESIRLFAPGKQLIEDIHYSGSQEGRSFARRGEDERVSTGTGTWFVWTPLLTPGAANAFPSIEWKGGGATIIIAAVLPNPEGEDEGSEWIELRNEGESAIDLTGWSLDDAEGGSRPYRITGVVLLPGAVRRFTDQETGIRLTNTLDTVRLFDPQGLIISLLSWRQAAPGQIYEASLPGEEVPAQILRVIDGDTIEVHLPDGAVERVRLIGVNAPETVHPRKPVERWGREAREFLQSMVEGETVTLQFDAERRDRYGRLLAYVLLSDGTNVNGELLRRGFAAVELRFPFSLSQLFEAYEAEARRLRIGLWTEAEVAHVMAEERAAAVQEGEGESPGEPLRGTVEELEEPSVLLLASEGTAPSLAPLFSEILSNPPKDGPLATIGEYLELFNPHPFPLPLGGWVLDDHPGSSRPQVLPEDLVIAPQGFLLLTGSALRISLNNDGEELSLTAPESGALLSLSFPRMERGQSYALHPRHAEWCVSLSPTPGERNLCRRANKLLLSAQLPQGGRVPSSRAQSQRHREKLLLNLKVRYQAILPAPLPPFFPLPSLHRAILPQILSPNFFKEGRTAAASPLLLLSLVLLSCIMTASLQMVQRRGRE